MKIRDVCIWCSKICTRPEGFDPQKNILVCSKECMQAEQAFRMHFSDENIGLRNFEQHGINPNHRGQNGKKKS